MNKIDKFEKNLKLLLSENDAIFEVKKGNLYLFVADEQGNDLVFSCGGGLNKYVTFELESEERPWRKKQNGK